jgi:hypothetical protein
MLVAMTSYRSCGERAVPSHRKWLFQPSLDAAGRPEL